MKLTIFNKTKMLTIISIKGIQFSKRTIILEKTNVRSQNNSLIIFQILATHLEIKIDHWINSNRKESLIL